MPDTRFSIRMLAAVMLLSASAVWSQAYPERALRIVTSEAGGNTDITARMVAPGLSERLGQPVIVENRAALIAAEVVASALPNGYTMFAAASNFWTAPLLRKVTYDPVKNFAPISILSSSPSVLIVHPSIAANSVKELIALTKARPGMLNYSAGAVGGAAHLSAELFKTMAGVDVVRVSYKGGAASLIAVVSGEVQMSFNSGSDSIRQAQAGKVKALAVTSAKPSALAPGLPTMAAAGLPGYEAETKTALFAPANTAPAIVAALNRAVLAVLGDAEMRSRFSKVAGADVIGSSPQELAVAMKLEMERLGRVIKAAGISAE